METPQNPLNSTFFAKRVFRWQGVNFGSVSKNPNAHKFMETGVTKRFALERIELALSLSSTKVGGRDTR